MAQRKQPNPLFLTFAVRYHRSQKFPTRKISKVENGQNPVKNQIFGNLIFLRIGQIGNFEKNFRYVSFNFFVTHPPPGLPWVKMKMRMQFREWGSSFSCSSQRGVRFYSDGLPRPGGGMGNAKIEWHIREKNFSKFPFRPIRRKMLVSKFWFLTNFYLVNFSQLNQKCGIVSSSSNSFVQIGKKFLKASASSNWGKIMFFGIG